jgi:hypothetical protein
MSHAGVPITAPWILGPNESALRFSRSGPLRHDAGLRLIDHPSPHQGFDHPSEISAGVKRGFEVHARPRLAALRSIKYFKTLRPSRPGKGPPQTRQVIWRSTVSGPASTLVSRYSAWHCGQAVDITSSMHTRPDHGEVMLFYRYIFGKGDPLLNHAQHRRNQGADLHKGHQVGVLRGLGTSFVVRVRV